MRIEVLIDVKPILGEGPLWDVDEQRLYFIDSFGCNVFPLHRRWARGSRLGCAREDRVHGVAPSGRRGRVARERVSFSRLQDRRL